MKLLNRIPSFAKNKYFLSLAAFCVIVLFLDRNDFFTQFDRQKELRQLQQSKRFYTAEIAAKRESEIRYLFLSHAGIWVSSFIIIGYFKESCQRSEV